MKKMVSCLLGLLVAGGLAQAQTPTPNCDFNGDGSIDHEDLFIFMNYWHTESSISLPTPTPTVPTYTISGHVAEFPGCGGSMRGVEVALLPLGATTQTSLTDGSFSFPGIPDGEYTLSISPPCNPFGCYPDTPVTVAGQNVSVEICPISGATPTITPTRTFTPTNTPTVPAYTISGHVAEFPGCGGSMRGVEVALLPLGATTETSLTDGSFSFPGIPDGEYTLSISPPCNPYGCYPDTPVTVAGQNVSVEICPISGATPTITPTRTFTPTNTPTVPAYTISGHVAEFPGCGGSMRGVQVALLPLGATTQTSLTDGSFSFPGIPHGEYTLRVTPSCNPYGCYPDTPVTVAGQNVSVEICPISGATPTITPTRTFTPTVTPET